ncbi:MAG TPA: alkaline phosphatase [Planctomycetaceae bacterium]|nr:alkaline phosphatase [Blastopirellula sp.]HAY81035.1 alkaline phosphatase [Planctomycetaceae bacterium]
MLNWRQLLGVDATSRRQFLAYNAALAAVPFLGNTTQAVEKPRFKDNPFSLGVASGDPDHRGVVLWTRLAPSPLQPDGGMTPTAVRVGWTVAEDEGFNKVVAKGSTLATPQLGHSIHVELSELKPDRWYWYRFHVGDAVSPVGRTRTLPLPWAEANQLKFAVTSCQNYEQGLFTAYEQMARDDVDLVFHLGDYIYEYEAGRNGKVRTHLGKEVESLGDYRVRLSQYRADPLLQGMHAQCPWFVTWDDHEFDNNYSNDISEEQGIDPQRFLIRRMAAYQAYYEMMPLRRRSLPRGPHMQLYRRAPFGRLADLMVLDTRQYRSDQPNGDRKSPLNEAALDPSNSMLGGEQRNWLYHSLINSRAKWNVLAQQVMMGMVGFPSDDEPLSYSMDQWPGYAAERIQLMKFLAERRVPNPVVLTGDIHSNWANELRVNDRDPESQLVASEFVATSLSSGGNGEDKPSWLEELQSENSFVKFHNRQRGYIRCNVTPETWTSDYMVVDQVLQPGGKTTVRASFVVESGDPTIKIA